MHEWKQTRARSNVEHGRRQIIVTARIDFTYSDSNAYAYIHGDADTDRNTQYYGNANSYSDSAT